MAVASDVVEKPFPGNDNAFLFPLPFTVTSATELVVKKSDANGIEEDLNYGSDYLIQGLGTSSQSVKYPIDETTQTLLQEGEVLAVKLNLPFTQGEDFPAQGGYQPQVHMRGLDKLTRLCQQLKAELARAVKLNITSGLNPDDILSSIDQAKQITANNAAAAAQSASDALSTAGNVVTLLSQTQDVKDETEVIKSETQTLRNEAEVFRDEAQAAGATGALADKDTVGTNDIDDGSVTFPKVNSALVAVTGNTTSTTTLTTPAFVKNATDTAVTAASLVTVSPQTDNYTLALGNQYVRMNKASAVNVTVPPDVFPVGKQILVSQVGAGQVTLVAGVGVTLNSAETLKTRKEFSTLSLIQVATNVWDVAGDVEAS